MPEDCMAGNFARGSEWRKWDLHIHSPGTKLGDAFRPESGDVWADYCRRLQESDVQVFGITDYFSADGYFKTVEEFQSRYHRSSKVFFPNVELRTTDVVNKQQEEVNLHLIFNPFLPDHGGKIRRFLNCLKTSKTQGGSRNVTASELSATGEFEEATTTREFIHEALVNTYGKDADRLEYVLIVTAANNDGIRAERGKKRKAALTDEIDKFSDAFFGNSKNASYFLNSARTEDGSYIDPKPVISGCDAHSFSDLDQRLGKVLFGSHGLMFEPTWIKADTTYEGLKQIIFEPANRVFIGDEPEVEKRVRERKTRYIESLRITSNPGYNTAQHGIWFDGEHVLLGRELVAIIGNKGSGKSALTDIIALLGNSHNQFSTVRPNARPEELFSFLNREKFLKGGCAGHFSGELHWYDGEPDKRQLDAQTVSHLPEKVEYLPQKYLERICANVAYDEFRATLNEVIFGYVKPKDKYGQNSLDDLIAYRTKQASEDIDSRRQELKRANEIVVSIERKLADDYRQQLEERVRLKKEELQAHATIRPDEKVNPDQGAAESSGEALRVEQLGQQISMIVGDIADLESERIQLAQSAEQMWQIRQAIARQVAAVSALKLVHQETLSAHGIAFEELVSIEVRFEKIDQAVGAVQARSAEIDQLLLTEDEIFKMAVGASEQKAMMERSLVVKCSSLQTDREDRVNRLGQPAREYQEYLTALDSWGKRQRVLLGDSDCPDPESLLGLQRELEKIAGDYPAELAAARANRNQISREIFDRKKGLTEFYNSVKQSIDGEIAKCREHLKDYDLSIEAGLRLIPSFADEFFKFINQSALGSFRGQDEGRLYLHELCDRVDDWEEKDQVFALLESIVTALHFDVSRDSEASRDVFKQMKGGRSVEDLYDYLYGLDYLDTKYDLKVDGKDLSELSPGERGGLLLVFYLMLDQRDVPLVIDQPEDNLDNKSVYEILVTFIKRAKSRRQIILVTHNPNLAVVADAEQIIRVVIDKKERRNDFSFFAGSIENERVNAALVDILEGTLPAFDNRRIKYRKGDSVRRR